MNHHTSIRMSRLVTFRISGVAECGHTAISAIVRRVSACEKCILAKVVFAQIKR